MELLIIGSVFIGTYVIPLFFLLTLKSSKVIESLHLENIQERKFPIMFFISIAILISTLLKRIPSIMELSLFFYGMTLALVLVYLLLYIKFKVSLHMIGISGLIGFFIFFSYEFKMNLLLFIAFLFFIAGAIASSRLKLKAHNFKEIYWGALIGIFSEFAVYLFYNM
ncbi:MAG: hypothetical protein COB73_03310 [Flavobacteriaceae bacterium]|nr:MAG: hypothetical protein COB73_03310 [Flavobacteriaceae bacterium]